MLKVLFSKKFKIMLLLIFFLFFYTFKVYAKNNDFSRGTGTKDDPYIISNAHELQNVGNYCGKEYENTYFKIEVKDNKLDMSDIKNFKPICGVDNTIVKDESVFFEKKYLENGFYGNLDGNNVEIDNLIINGSNFYYTGLFSTVINAKIKNIGIGKNSKITSSSLKNDSINAGIGGIVGYAWNTEITNVWNKGIIETDFYFAGGIIGASEETDISYSYNNGTVKSNNISGGIIGIASLITVNHSYNNGNISGDIGVGGIIGYYIAQKCELKNVYNNGNIDGNIGVGGIMGWGGIEINKFYPIKIIDTYNNGKIKGNKSVGGIVGYMSSNEILSTSYNKGNIEGNISIGGIVGGSEYRNSHIINIKDVYNLGNITGIERVGGIVGYYSFNNVTNIANYNQNINGNNKVGLLIGEVKNGNIKNAYTVKENTNLNGFGYYNENHLNEDYLYGYLYSSNVQGYNTNELKNQENYKGFDFENVWIMRNGRAELRNVYSEDTSDNNINNNSSTSGGIDKTSAGPIIKYNGKTIDVESFLYNDGRTFVDLYDFCESSKLCSVSNIENDKYIIDKNISENKKSYKYRILHTKGTKIFTSYIEIGGRTILDDISKLESDVQSCPSNAGIYQCNQNKLYIPVRFLSQALGFTVKWDGENNTVIIEDNLIDNFLSKYDVVLTTEKECNSSDCIVNGRNNLYTVKIDESYYLNVLDKNTNEVMDYYKGFSFYNTIENIGSKKNPIFRDGYFQINKNKLEVKNISGTNIDKAKNIASIILYEIRNTDSDYKKSNYNLGGYPIVIDSTFTLSNEKANSAETSNVKLTHFIDEQVDWDAMSAYGNKSERFRLNEKGWWMYQDPDTGIEYLAVAAPTKYLLGSRYNWSPMDGITYYEYGDIISLNIAGESYQAMVIDSCGACMGTNNPLKIDVYVSRDYFDENGLTEAGIAAGAVLPDSLPTTFGDDTPIEQRTTRPNRSNTFYYDPVTGYGATYEGKQTLEGESAWYATGRAAEFLASINSTETWTDNPNGGQFCNSADAQKFNQGTEPKAGSLISWGYEPYGHVAFVENVNPDGTFDISEAGISFGLYGENARNIVSGNNAARRENCERNGTGCFNYRTRVTKDLYNDFKCFIYLKEPKN